MSANADSTALQLDLGGGDSEARGVFNLTIKGRRFAVTVSSARRPLAELLREFVEVFGSQIASLQ